MADHMDLTLSWLASSDRDTRLDYLREILNCLQIEEVNAASSLVRNAKKKKSLFPRGLAQRLKRKQKSLVEHNNFHDARSTSTETAVPEPEISAPVSEKLITSPNEELIPELKEITGWWQIEYGLDNIVAMDCEMVTLRQGHKAKAATVAIVNYSNVVEYSARIFHKKGSYLDDKKAVSIHGFFGTKLENGEDFDEVRNNVICHTDGKLTVAVNGATDWSSLDIPLASVIEDTFDLHRIFNQPTGNYSKKTGEEVFQPISLRRLCMHYFNEDIQKETHSALSDAMATMRLFKEIYCPLVKNKHIPNDSKYFNNTYQFENILKITK